MRVSGSPSRYLRVDKGIIILLLRVPASLEQLQKPCDGRVGGDQPDDDRESASDDNGEDDDGLIDYPLDPGCDHAGDTSETGACLSAPAGEKAWLEAGKERGGEQHGKAMIAARALHGAKSAAKAWAGYFLKSHLKLWAASHARPAQMLA